MYFHCDNDLRTYTISSYNDSTVVVNGSEYIFPVCVFSTCTPLNWPHDGGGVLTENSFLFLKEYELEVLLWGTGKDVSIDNFDLANKIVEHKLFFEIMPTQSACRTFNILSSENRRVCAVLFP
ncbi:MULTISPECIES: Mth938-like domain-containing protein [Candidatus Ichthyocystis]|uniref:Mth938-like domain-containing protein n=1 Tax=Candidatus Ichthyocystis TaxID=2929841 RepID=UPI000B895EFC|nr:MULTISPECIES: Mth938-like domain-containing protein [Ichthyocystis]